MPVTDLSTGVRGRHWPGLVVLLITLAVYGNSYPGGWIFDDPYTIPGDPDIETLWPMAKAFSSPSGSPGAGRPLTAFSFHLNAVATGLNPAAFRLVNVFIHGLNAWIIFALVRVLLEGRPAWKTWATRVGWLTAVLWAVHPLNTSAVTYISQRAESLMTLFFLSSLYCLARSDGPIASRGWQLGALAAAWCATLSKEIGLMIPLLLIPFERSYFSTSWREAWTKRKYLCLAMFVPSAMALGLLYRSDPRHGTVLFSYQGINSWTYLCTQAVAIMMYIGKVFHPDSLILDYGWPMADTWQKWLPPALALACMFAAGIWLMIRKPTLGFPVLLFFALLAPSSSVIPIVTEIMAEHRMYLASSVVILLTVLGLVSLLRIFIQNGRVARRLALLLALVPAALLAARTIQQQALYRDPRVMWRYNCEVTPTNRRSFFNLAHEYRIRGQVQEAMAAYERALMISPDYPDAHAGLSYCLYDQQDYTKALPFAMEARRLEPDIAEHYFTLAMIQAHLGKQEDALATLRSGLTIAPESDKLKKGTVVVYFILDQAEEALNQLAYWSNLPRQSPLFISTAAALAESAGKPEYAGALRKSCPE